MACWEGCCLDHVPVFLLAGEFVFSLKITNLTKLATVSPAVQETLRDSPPAPRTCWSFSPRAGSQSNLQQHPPNPALFTCGEDVFVMAVIIMNYYRRGVARDVL